MTPQIDENIYETCQATVLAKYGKTVEDLKKDTEYLIDWFKKQPHLPEPDARKIEFILVHSKFSLEKSKEKLDMHYSMKNFAPEMFANWDPCSPQIEMVYETAAWIQLPKLSENLSRVGIFRLIDSNPDKFNPIEYFKTTFIHAELNYHRFFNYGDDIIYDLQGFKFGHISKLTPAVLKKVDTIAKKAYALKLNGIHFLNAPTQMNMVMSVLKPILKPKIFNRIHIHENLESLYKVIPQHILPKDYGGEEATFKEIFDEQIKEIKAKREKLIEINKVRSDESKRIGKLEDSMFGSIDGSFRQLQVD